jgi:hypothetical protein
VPLAGLLADPVADTVAAPVASMSAGAAELFSAAGAGGAFSFSSRTRLSNSALYSGINDLSIVL